VQVPPPSEVEVHRKREKDPGEEREVGLYSHEITKCLDTGKGHNNWDWGAKTENQEGAVSGPPQRKAAQRALRKQCLGE